VFDLKKAKNSLTKKRTSRSKMFPDSQ